MQAKSPLKWTGSFDLFYGNEKNNKGILVEGNKIHWFLSLTVRNMFAFKYPSVREKYFKANEGVDKKDIGVSSNYLAVGLGFVVSDGPIKSNHTHERKFIFWTLDELPDLKSDWEKISEYKQPHSEDILYSYLQRPEVISQIINYLKKEGIIPGCKIYAVILDLHSRQYMCRVCQQKTMDVQTIKNENSFLSLLSKKLKEVEGYFLPNKHSLRMLTRVSADMPYLGDSAGDEHPEEAYNIFKTWEHLVENPKEKIKDAIKWENLKDEERDVQLLSGKCIVHRHDHEDLLRHYGLFEVGIARSKLPKEVFTSDSPGKAQLSESPPPVSPYVSLGSLWFKPGRQIPLSSISSESSKRSLEDDNISSAEGSVTKYLKNSN
jgi:hypothetical protein